MEPLIIETKVDEKARCAFFKAMSAQGNTLVTVIAAGLFLLLVVIGVSIYKKQGYLDHFCVICALMPLLILIGQITVPSRRKKEAKRVFEREGDDENRFTFFEDHFDNDYVNKLASGHSEHSYASLVRVLEDDEHVFIFIDRGRAFIIRREDVTEEQMEALRDKLRSLISEHLYEIRG